MDRIVRIEIEVIAWHRRAATAVGRRWLDTPPGLDGYGVQQYLEQRFGPPLTVATSTDDAGDEHSIGWFFPHSALVQLDLAQPGTDLLVVPYVSLPDGSRRELFAYNAELRNRFEDLARSIDVEMETLRRREPFDAGDPPPREGAVRLAEESLELYYSDPDGIALEVGGWLRRLIAEGHTYLLIELGETRYVQFVTHDGSWLRGEVVGPDYVPDAPLSQRELDGIRAAGWYEPERDPLCRNFWFEWGDPDLDEPPRVDAAAAMAASTLCTAFGLVDATAATVRTGTALPAADDDAPDGDELPR